LATFLLILHLLVSLLLITVVLLQSGKSADLAGAFGGYGSQSSFGPRGMATFMSKFTTILAVLFMVITLLLMIISKNDVKKASTKSGASGMKYSVVVLDASSQKPINHAIVKYYQSTKKVSTNDKEVQKTKEMIAKHNKKTTNKEGLAVINNIIAKKPIFFTVSAKGYNNKKDFEVNKFKIGERIVINLSKIRNKKKAKVNDIKTDKTDKKVINKEVKTDNKKDSKKVNTSSSKKKENLDSKKSK